MGGMGKFCFLLFLIFGIGLGMSAAEEIPPDDRALLDFFHRLYETTPQEAAERLYVNFAVSPQNLFLRNVLRRKYRVGAEELEAARTELKRIRSEIERGREWPLKQRERFELPYRGEGSLVFGPQEYDMSSLSSETDGASWSLAWDEKFLYAEVCVPDSDIRILGYDSSRGEFAWEADCVEIFIMPDPELRVYCEIVINPAGAVFAACHCNDTRGWFVYALKLGMEGLNAAVEPLPGGGYRVRAAIPFAELPGYRFGAAPEAGRSLFMQLIHIDNARRRAVRPLLYDPHNVFGYFQVTLKKTPSNEFSQP